MYCRQKLGYSALARRQNANDKHTCVLRIICNICFTTTKYQLELGEVSVLNVSASPATDQNRWEDVSASPSRRASAAVLDSNTSQKHIRVVYFSQSKIRVYAHETRRTFQRQTVRVTDVFWATDSKNSGYNLRQRSHNLVLPSNVNAVVKQNFVYRMLFRDIY